MKLRTKIFSVFIAALIFNVIIIIIGLTGVLDSLSSMMMKKQAEQLALFLQHRIAASSDRKDDDDERALLSRDFETAKHIADESGNYDIRKILLIRPDFTVEAGYPTDEAGKNYSSDDDIREAIDGVGMNTVIEKVELPDGTVSHDIDVVSAFLRDDGTKRVIEIKLDFAKSIALLESQYARIETGAVVTAIVLLVALLFILLMIISRTAVRPVLKVTRAMERVAEGDLDVTLSETSRDEFALLSRRFNEMVTGLKERIRLSKYVSRGTRDAVRGSIERGEQHHVTERKILTLFFSDIRGFTSYSETRDPSEVINVLNRILSLQAKIIRGHGGDVDKFVGDEVMAVFTDPMKAIDAAVDIRNEMENARTEVDHLHIGIGIHEGEVVQGDVGSEETRNFTVIGDSVNTAARLESIAGPDEILISEGIANRTDIRDRFTLKLKGELSLKGKGIPIRTYEVI